MSEWTDKRHEAAKNLLEMCRPVEPHSSNALIDDREYSLLEDWFDYTRSLENDLPDALAEIDRLRAVLQIGDELATVAFKGALFIDGYYYPLNEELEQAAEKYKKERKQEASR